MEQASVIELQVRLPACRSATGDRHAYWHMDGRIDLIRSGFRSDASQMVYMRSKLEIIDEVQVLVCHVDRVVLCSLLATP